MNQGGNRKEFAGRLSGVRFLEIAALAVGMLWLPPALAAQEASAAQGTGQPARAVRLSYVYGNVVLSQNGQVLADPAVANTPLLEGMTLATGGTGRASVQFEDGSVARLAPDSELTLNVLRGEGPSGDAELALNYGLAYFELQDNPHIGQISVHFGDSVVTASGFTVLRITMDKPPGSLAVFSGNAHLNRADGATSVDLHSGQNIALTAGNPSDYQLSDSIPPNSWDAWNSDRDQAQEAAAANQNQPPQNLGEGNNNPDMNSNPAWDDLDNYGSWYDVPGQGYVWSPYAAENPGFDPYADGNWTWMPGFGYIWASGYPWGYIPFSCGTWNFYSGFGWGWAPGMGGSEPWWTTGFYGGPNIGFAPPGYFPIRRPPPRRHQPIGRIPHPVIGVHRTPNVLNAGLPSRRTSAPVNINGDMVRALRPLPSSRPGYANAFLGAGSRTAPVYTRPTVNRSTAMRGNAFAGNRPGYMPVFSNMPRPVYVSPRAGSSLRGSAFSNRGFFAPSQRRFGSSSLARPASSPRVGGFHGGGGFHPSGGGFHGGGSHGGGGSFHGGGGGQR